LKSGVYNILKGVVLEMTEAITIPAKYVFLDVVGFSHNRSIEAQTEIVDAVNRIVIDSVGTHNIADDARIFLPTGDGICLALLNIEDPYDIHMRIALRITEGVEKHNAASTDDQRKFQVRIGINMNVDNLIIDVNGKRNLAGAGINLAQRVMSVADGNQIVVGQPVFDMLNQREKYMKAFRPYIAAAKHGLTLNVYQFVVDGFPGLNVTTPSQFRRESQSEENLSELSAYYLAHAMKHRAEIAKCVDHGKASYSMVVLLWMLAQDSLSEKHWRAFEPHPLKKAYVSREDGFLGQFRFYNSIEFWVCADFAELILAEELESAWKFLEGGGSPSNFHAHFVTPEGQKKLREEWPDIWQEFDLEAHSNIQND
jgi:class 3 adenylate cyclase